MEYLMPTDNILVLLLFSFLILKCSLIEEISVLFNDNLFIFVGLPCIHYICFFIFVGLPCIHYVDPQQRRGICCIIWTV